MFLDKSKNLCWIICKDKYVLLYTVDIKPLEEHTVLEVVLSIKSIKEDYYLQGNLGKLFPKRKLPSSRGRGQMYTYGWFMLIFRRKSQNSVKQLSLNK